MQVRITFTNHFINDCLFIISVVYFLRGLFFHINRLLVHHIKVAIVFPIEQNIEIYAMITCLGIGHYNNNESSQNQVTTHDELNQMNTQQSINPNQDTQENTHNFAEHNGVLTNNVDEIMCTNPCIKFFPCIFKITITNKFVSH